MSLIKIIDKAKKFVEKNAKAIGKGVGYTTLGLALYIAPAKLEAQTTENQINLDDIELSDLEQNFQTTTKKYIVEPGPLDKPGNLTLTISTTESDHDYTLSKMETGNTNFTLLDMNNDGTNDLGSVTQYESEQHIEFSDKNTMSKLENEMNIVKLAEYTGKVNLRIINSFTYMGRIGEDEDVLVSVDFTDHGKQEAEEATINLYGENNDSIEYKLLDFDHDGNFDIMYSENKNGKRLFYLDCGSKFKKAEALIDMVK